MFCYRNTLSKIFFAPFISCFNITKVARQKNPRNPQMGVFFALIGKTPIWGGEET